MRKLLILGSLIAAAAAPVAAHADVSCVNPQTNAKTGVVVGAVGGAAAGSLLAGRHSRGEGAVLGALAGGVLGGVVGNSQKRCPDGYYAYDDQTRQYYDNNGHAYAQPPGAQAAYGPAPQGGYGPPPGPGYDQRGPGYDQRGPGYDQRGPGYDQRGPAPGYGAGGGFWANAPQGIRERTDFLEQRIRANANSGRISPRQARAAYADLGDIRRLEGTMRNRDGGRLNPTDRDYLQGRLDRALQNLHMDRDNDRRY